MRRCLGGESGCVLAEGREPFFESDFGRRLPKFWVHVDAPKPSGLRPVRMLCEHCLDKALRLPADMCTRERPTQPRLSHERGLRGPMDVCEVAYRKTVLRRPSHGGSHDCSLDFGNYGGGRSGFGFGRRRCGQTRSGNCCSRCRCHTYSVFCSDHSGRTCSIFAVGIHWAWRRRTAMAVVASGSSGAVAKSNCTD